MTALGYRESKINELLLLKQKIMAQLAIKGHATRGQDVIEILEMLGGKNTYNNNTGFDIGFYYSIEDGGIRSWERKYGNFEYMYFTLEEFLEKFPYKVGDKVRNARINDFVGEIINARWDDNENQIIYTVEWDDVIKSTLSYTAKGLIPYKKETMEDKFNLLHQLKDYFNNTPREVVEKEWHDYDKYNEITPTVNEYLEYVNKIRQPKYPKTYIECAKILDCFDAAYIDGYKYELLENLQELLICRDAYWKIAGEQMGLGKHWKPNWNNDLSKYYISFYNNKVDKGVINYSNKILASPTEEMRDAFYENFKELIEECKELL